MGPPRVWPTLCVDPFDRHTSTRDLVGYPARRVAPADSAQLSHPADVFAVAHVLITLVDLIKGVFLCDQLVEFQSPVAVHHQQLGDGGAGTAGPEQGATHLLLRARGPDQAELYRL